MSRPHEKDGPLFPDSFDFDAMRERLDTALPMDALLAADKIATQAHQNMRRALRVTIGAYHIKDDGSQEPDLDKPVAGTSSVTFPEGCVLPDGRFIDQTGEEFESAGEYLKALAARYTKTQLGGGNA